MCEHTEHTLGVSTQLTTDKGCFYMYYLLYNSSGSHILATFVYIANSAK